MILFMMLGLRKQDRAYAWGARRVGPSCLTWHLPCRQNVPGKSMRRASHALLVRDRALLARPRHRVGGVVTAHGAVID